MKKHPTNEIPPAESSERAVALSLELADAHRKSAGLLDKLAVLLWLHARFNLPVDAKFRITADGPIYNRRLFLVLEDEPTGRWVHERNAPKEIKPLLKRYIK